MQKKLTRECERCSCPTANKSVMGNAPGTSRRLSVQTPTPNNVNIVQARRSNLFLFIRHSVDSRAYTAVCPTPNKALRRAFDFAGGARRGRFAGLYSGLLGDDLFTRAHRTSHLALTLICLTDLVHLQGFLICLSCAFIIQRLCHTTSANSRTYISSAGSIVQHAIDTLLYRVYLITRVR